MLTPDDLTLIRAALRYFADEMLPHDGPCRTGDEPHAHNVRFGLDSDGRLKSSWPEIRHYFNRPPDDRSCLSRKYLLGLGDQLTNVDIRWVRCCIDTDMLLDRRPLCEEEARNIRHDDGIRVAILLLPCDDTNRNDRH